ncbi:MAG: hypothetical protein JW913_11500 [Chitinispirillaceae bacterium]|nr:hypothetical protein [Chitinispirillaceae bacterium]
MPCRSSPKALTTLLFFSATPTCSSLGGHVGFMGRGENGIYWHERRTISFIHDVCA